MSKVRVSLLEGQKAIARYLSEHLGFEVSIEAMRRYTAIETDPLPVRRWLPLGGRARMVASEEELDAWCARKWR